MIPYEEAEKKVLEASFPLDTEEVALGKGLGRVLARDIVSKIDMPPFDKSAMDGYAYISGDTSDSLEIVEIIPAGRVPEKTIGRGQCAKIMTGGILPRGADRVVKREVTIEEDGRIRIVGRDVNRNVCLRGEDVKTGDTVLSRGTLLRPAEIGIAASVGQAGLTVFRRPRIGILTTGSELVPPGQSLDKGRIFDSNSSSLAAQAAEIGLDVRDIRSAADTPEAIRTAAGDMLDKADVVFISGGVSMGDYDYVPSVLRMLGVRLHFEKVAVRPGMPTVFGTRADRFAFGIPGNPVSTFVIFEVLIKPFLYRLMGHDLRPETVPGVLVSRFKRRNTERTAFVPVKYGDGTVELLSYHGSAHIHSLGRANGLLGVPRGTGVIEEGTTVHVRFL